MPQMSCHGHLWQNTTAARKLCALAERLRNTKVAAPRWRHARSSSPLKTITNHDWRAARSFTLTAPHPARARPIAIGACMGLGRRLRRAHAPILAACAGIWRPSPVGPRLRFVHGPPVARPAVAIGGTLRRSAYAPNRRIDRPSPATQHRLLHRSASRLHTVRASRGLALLRAARGWCGCWADGPPN